MAKGNLILGTAHGSVGDVTMMRRQGSQVSRVRVRKIGNPRSSSQAANRALLATLGTAYSYMKPIVDHSFQGLNGAGQNMQRFMKLNQGIARGTGSVDPAGTDEGYNFNFKGESVLRPNPYAMSRGTLPAVGVYQAENSDYHLSAVPAEIGINYSYQQFADALGVPLGAQVTFCGVVSETGDSYGSFVYARVVLLPDDGDGDTPLLRLATPADQSNFEYVINSPNAANSGLVGFDDTYSVMLGATASPSQILGLAVITSYWDGSKWLRSNSDMVVKNGYESSNTMSEVYMSYMNEETEPQSDLYLNQGEVSTASGILRRPNILFYRNTASSAALTDTGVVLTAADSRVQIPFSSPDVDAGFFPAQLLLKGTAVVGSPVAAEPFVVTAVGTVTVDSETYQRFNITKSESPLTSGSSYPVQVGTDKVQGLTFYFNYN